MARSPHSRIVIDGSESVDDVLTWDGTKYSGAAPSGGSGTTQLKVFYFEDDGWSNGDTAGDTNRTACRKTVKRAYDAIAAGLPHALLSWKTASAGIGIVNFGSGAGNNASTTAVIDSTIVGSYGVPAAIVLTSHMTLWVPPWFELRAPDGYNGGASGTHQRFIAVSSLVSSSAACEDVHVIVDGIINLRGGTYGANADKVTAISLDTVLGTTVRTMYRRGQVKNWRGLNTGALEAWGVVMKDCVNGEVFGIHVLDDELGDSATGIASQYSTGFHVHDVLVHDLTGQGISSYGSRQINFHDFDVHSLYTGNGVNFEYCDNYEVHDGSAGRGVARVVSAANNPRRTNVNMSSTPLPTGTITVLTTTKLRAASVAKPGKAIVYNDAGQPQIITYTGTTSTTLTGCTGGTGNISSGVVVPWQGCDYGVVILMDSNGTLNGTGVGKLRRVSARGNATAGVGIKNVWTGTAATGTSGTQLTPAVNRITLAAAATVTQTGATITINGHSGTGSYTSGSTTVTITSAGTIVAGDSGTVTSSLSGIPGGDTGTADVSYAVVAMRGAWVRVGAGSNPLVRIESVTPGSSFNTDTPHGGTAGDTIYVIGSTVDIDDCDLQENANGGIHLPVSAALALVAQQHSIRVNPTTRFLDNTGGKDFRGANPAGSSSNWNASTVPLQISGGTVTQIAVPTVALDAYVWNWSMCTIEYDFDFDTIVAGTDTGLVKLRGGGIAGATTNKGDLDRTIVNAAADFAKLPSRWTLRLQPGEAVIFKGGAQGLSAAPTIASQRIWVS